MPEGWHIIHSSREPSSGRATMRSGALAMYSTSAAVAVNSGERDDALSLAEPVAAAFDYGAGAFVARSADLHRVFFFGIHVSVSVTDIASADGPSFQLDQALPIAWMAGVSTSIISQVLGALIRAAFMGLFLLGIYSRFPSSRGQASRE